MESTIVIPISPAPWTRRTFGVSLTTAATSSNGCTSASMSFSEETPPNRRAKSKKKKKKKGISSRAHKACPLFTQHTPYARARFGVNFLVIPLVPSIPKKKKNPYSFESSAFYTSLHPSVKKRMRRSNFSFTSSLPSI